MKTLKYTLIIVAIFDVILFLISQFNPELFLSISPQIHITGEDYSYPKLVGYLILSLGLPRLYGGLFIKEKGAFIASIWSWVIELIWVVSGIFYGMSSLNENLIPIILAPLLILWSILYYRNNFKSSS